MTVERTINLLQAINAEVSEMVHCPELEDYPESIDTMELPLALTDLETGEFKGVGGDNIADDDYVIRVIFEAFGQDDLGPKKAEGVRLYDAYRTKYLDEETYAVKGTKIIEKEPYRTTVVPPFRTTGITVVEYPVDSGRWWHGFEIRFGINQEWLWSCD